MRPRILFNPKRRLRRAPLTALERDRLLVLAKRVRYGGNPEHKRNPGDFRLTPPASPRRGKSLCDDVAITRRSTALRLLKAGLTAGLIDDRWSGDEWPQLIWAVTADGKPVEAQSEGGGVYHGYPMPEADPLRNAVAEAWGTP